jgi:hypothetical protein
MFTESVAGAAERSALALAQEGWLPARFARGEAAVAEVTAPVAASRAAAVRALAAPRERADLSTSRLSEKGHFVLAVHHESCVLPRLPAALSRPHPMATPVG